MSEAAAQPKKRGRKALLFGILFTIALGAGGGFWFWRQSRAAAAHSEPAAIERGPGAVLVLEPFLVNLADPEASRFLRLTLRLVIDDEHAAADFGENEVEKARVRSAILELLTTQKSDALVTPDGKQALKQAIAGRAGDVLHLEIRDVLFTDFVVQF